MTDEIRRVLKFVGCVLWVCVAVVWLCDEDFAFGFVLAALCMVIADLARRVLDDVRAERTAPIHAHVHPRPQRELMPPPKDRP